MNTNIQYITFTVPFQNYAPQEYKLYRQKEHCSLLNTNIQYIADTELFKITALR
jgi:hypothetical protein